MVKQTQEQKQNVKVVINLAETKKKRKPRRRRIREPPQGKSSFQQILRENQPQVYIRRIYDPSPYLDEVQRLRSQQQGVISIPADGVKQPDIPLTSQAQQRRTIVEATLRRLESEDAGIPARVGERMSMPTNPNTSTLQGTPEQPPAETPAPKPARKKRSDAGVKRGIRNRGGVKLGGGIRGNIFGLREEEKKKGMQEAMRQRYQSVSLNMLAGGTNAEGQV
jgi:hypothetical protein